MILRRFSHATMWFFVVASLWACPGPNPDPDGGEDGGLTEDVFERDNSPTLPIVQVQQLYIYPDDSSTLLSSAIAGASESVDVVMYLFLDAGGLAQALINAHARGVSVRVIMEDMSENNTVRSALTSEGVPVHWGRSDVNLTHQKSVMIDGEDLFIMTHNFTSSGLYQNREHILYISQLEPVAEAATMFAADWDNALDSGIAEHLVWSPHNARDAMLDLLRNAEEKLYIQSQLMSDGATREMLNAKARAGVDVRIILPDPDDVDESTAAASALSSSGVQVKYFPDSFVHTKMVISDDIFYAGSINFSHNSIENNRELGAFTTGTATVDKALQQFLADWYQSLSF